MQEAIVSREANPEAAIPSSLRALAAGYTRAFTSLEDGVRDYVQRYLSQPDPYR